MTNRQMNGLVGLGLMALGVVECIARPDKTLHVLRGGGWYDNYCSCSKLTDGTITGRNPTCAVHGDRP